MPPELPQPKPIELEPAPGTVSGLGGIVESTLLRFLQRAINSATETLADVLRFGLQIFLEAAEQALIELNRSMVMEVIERLPPGNPVVPYLQDMLSGTSQAAFFSLGGFASQIGSSAAGNALGILLRPLGYERRTCRINWTTWGGPQRSSRSWNNSCDHSWMRRT
jgi:hypothetical protein